MRILQFGRTGQVATAVQAAAQGRAEVIALSRADCDLENPEAVRAAILAADCDLVLNTAAFTHVDPAYVETDEAKPINAYGRSKLAGEQAVLAHPKAVVLRISWVFSRYGRNYVSFMLRLAREREVLKIVADQSGTPTDGEALAEFLISTAPRWAAASVGEPVFGLFHFANTGETTRFDFAKAAIDRDPLTKARLEPTTQAAFAEPAPRPPRSPLDTGKLRAVFGYAPEPWRTAVERTADRLVATGFPA